jgi:hypothetical protein
MTHKATLEAIRLSLLLGDTTADRHGVYANRKPKPAPLPPPLIAPIHQFVMPIVMENYRSPEAGW